MAEIMIFFEILAQKIASEISWALQKSKINL